jgi:CRISPR/Cas system-associated exonuclease Cas4 (RecB family)
VLHEVTADRSPISGRSLRLSKSKLVSFLQCPKKLWLQVHRPAEARHTSATLVRFAEGNVVGEQARRTEPHGILIETGHDLGAALRATRELIVSLPARPLFEAAFVRNDVIVRADILKPVDASGLDWDLIEVKNTRQPRDWHTRDLAIQAWVLGNHIKLRRLIIAHPARPASRLQATEYAFQDVTAKAAGYQRTTPGIVVEAHAVVRAPEPDVPAGPQCTAPYPCEFWNYCSAKGRSC